MRARLKRTALIVGILLGAILLTIGMGSLRKAPPKKPLEQLDPLVAVLELETMTASFEVSSQGTVQPRTETVVSAEVSGTIVEISPKMIAGGVFGKGEVLMRIDPTNYTVAVAQAEALVKQRQIEFDGAERLRKQGYRAESEYASAAAALASAKAELVRAERNLERTYIRLPYEGMVRGKEADLGQFVSPGTRLGVVFATDFAEVRLPLTDTDLAYVELPTAARFAAADSLNGPAVVLSAVQKGSQQTWNATIVRTEGVVDEKSRVTYVVARIEDPYRLHADGIELPMGTFVSAKIEGTVAENIVRVPRAVVRGSDQLVFVDDDNRIRIRSVRIARSDADYVYVRGGAKAGDRVVTTKLASPINGMTVRTQPIEEQDNAAARAN
ncbi:MAG: efflux RND transporter periplasmic adaptor subunit [Woeseiaceae bacterium]|nr:efflux RND transporter periplasmic adaptor subunit [Woeseiaceae bacterium]